MISQAHGRRYHFGQPQGNGAQINRKPTKYICNHPNGGAVVKSVLDAAGFEEPVALWYQSGKDWHLNTVVDRKNMPEWAKNYTQGLARKKA